MMPATRQRMLLVGALVVSLLVVVGISTSGIERNLVYYLDADELLARGVQAQGATIRLGGLVQRHSLVWQPKTLSLRFAVGNAAEGGNAILVSSHGAPPQMFQEGVGAVVEGTFDGHEFVAERVLVKHSNEYRPPEGNERPQNVFGTLEAPPLRAPDAPIPSAPAARPAP